MRKDEEDQIKWGKMRQQEGTTQHTEIGTNDGQKLGSRKELQDTIKQQYIH